MAVTWPAAGNLGGGGFMLIRMADGTSEAIDYRERAPLAASRDMYLDASGNVIKGASTDGYKAIGVPGTVAGLMLVHKRHGKLKWSELVEPARARAIVNDLARFIGHEDEHESAAAEVAGGGPGDRHREGGATAASMALPPFFMTSTPTCDAMPLVEDTMPCRAMAGSRNAEYAVVVKRRRSEAIELSAWRGSVHPFTTGSRR